MKPDKEQKLREIAGDEVVDQALAEIERKEGEAAVAGIRAKAKDEKKPEVKVEVETETGDDEEKPEEGEDSEEEVPSKKKEAEFSEPELLAALKEIVAPIMAAIAEKDAALADMEARISAAEAQTLQLKEAQETRLTDLATSLKDAKAKIAELTGDLPKSTVKGMRASQSPVSEVSEQTLTEKGITAPAPDPMSQFITGFIMKP